MDKRNVIKNEHVISLKRFFPEVAEFSHTKINVAKPFVPSFEGKGLTSILYIEKGNFAIRYETGELLTPRGGTFYYHPPVSLKYQTFDKTITPYSMYRLVLNLSLDNLPTFSSHLLKQKIIDHLPSRPFLRKAPPLMISAFKTIISEYDQKQAGFMVQIENSILQILISAMRAAMCQETDMEGTHWLTEKVDRFLAENMEFMGPVEKLFDQLGVKRNKGYDVFHEIIGLNPKEYILRKKVEFAKQMLIQDHDITTIAYELGFSSSQRFATVFKKLTCITPSDFKKLHKLMP